MKLIYTILLSLLINSVHAQDASEILKRSAEKYAKMHVYMDSGKVVSNFYNTARPHSTALLFKTAWSENGAFNFEYCTLGSTDINVLNRNPDKQVKVWQGFANKVITGQPFDVAMGGFIGISNFSVALVPSLLMPEEKLIRNNLISFLTDPQISSTEQVQGLECYKITSTTSPRGTWNVWIAKSDLLIRKVENDLRVNNFNVKATYTYFPYTTKDPSVFVFRPSRKVTL